MSRTFPGFWVLLIAAALSGCTSPPVIMVSSAGTLPTAGTFTTVVAEGEGVPEFAALAADRLQRHGLQPSENGDYVLQAALARRPAHAGLFIPEQPDAWLRSPAPDRASKETAALVLTLSKRATGQEVYRVAAVGRPRRANDETVSLIEAALPDL